MAHAKAMRNVLQGCALLFSAFRIGERMSLADRYRQFAAECVRVAQQATNADDKASLLQMAEAWLRLAQRAGKSDDKGEQ